MPSQLSNFQSAYLSALVTAADFVRWCVTPEQVTGLHEEYSPTLEMNVVTPLFSYYTTDGALHATRVGRHDVLAQFRFPPVSIGEALR